MSMRFRASLALPLAVLVLTLAAPAQATPSVAALQVALRARGIYLGTIDGIRGPLTTRAVRIFQRRARIRVDGIVGPQTRRALGHGWRRAFGSRALRRGMAGWDVAALQFVLATHGFPSGNFDGGFGPRTQAAVRRYQRFARLAVDGIAGRATLRALRSPPPRSPIWLIRPLRAPMGDRFGPRGARFHSGIDFPASYGTRVQAAGRGRVVYAGWDSGGYGYIVLISHGYGVRTLYAHLSTLAVRRGRYVRAGWLVGRVGASGAATGPHLHFEVRVRGAAVNPLTAFR
jgi:murein DD-endopeptidase MepM/ murein hydrolase activator NlpD